MFDRSIDLSLMQFWCNIAPMKRQSISFTKPNDDWLTAQTESQEFSSKSEVINDLIRLSGFLWARRQQQRAEWIPFYELNLLKGEQSGFIEATENTAAKYYANLKSERNVTVSYKLSLGDTQKIICIV